MEKILCVDNDPSLLYLYHEELSEEGYKVVLAKKESEAVSELAKEKPPVVVLDFRAPVTQGLEILTALLDKNPQVQVIVNTTYPQYKENFTTRGAFAYVVKSFDLEELKQKLREALEKHRRTSYQSILSSFSRCFGIG